jgi:hypothetical protein
VEGLQGIWMEIRKSFLVLFFKKELLACFLSLARQEVG